MDYYKLYYQIIEHRKKNPVGDDVYTEKHHILPRSLGGTDDSDNIVPLTAREHFICHYLLSKMYDYGTEAWYKTNHAFMFMKSHNSGQKRYYNSRLYESQKESFSKVMSRNQKGKRNSQYGKIWITNLETGECTRICKNSTIPSGWTKGRNVSIRYCQICNHGFIDISSSKKKCCSENCRRQLLSMYDRPEQKPRGFVTRKEEFMNLFELGLSVTECLRTMGYNPCCGDKRGYIRQWLNEKT